MTFSTPPRARVIVVAAAIVFLNALAVVYVAAHNRSRYSELSHLRQTHDRLVVRRGQLELETLTLAAHARVAHLATSKMHMQAPQKVHIVRVP
jgi:cell division protein FtsL